MDKLSSVGKHHDIVTDLYYIIKGIFLAGKHVFQQALGYKRRVIYTAQCLIRDIDLHRENRIRKLAEHFPVKKVAPASDYLSQDETYDTGIGHKSEVKLFDPGIYDD